MIRHTQEDDRRRTDPAAAQGGLASSAHQGLRRPGNAASREALKQTDLGDMGLSAEDRMRDRRSNGDERRR